MKLFDVIGGLVVVGWVALVINVGWTAYAPRNIITVSDEKAQLTEGESWMLLRRADKEIGFVHETRTNLDPDWLFEYTLFINVNPIGAVKSEIKSTMDSTGVIRSVKASTTLGPKEISLEAKVEGNTVVITSSLEQMNRTINLKKPPKLSTHVYRALASAEHFEPGDIYKEKFFDAISLGMSELIFEFVEDTTVDVYGEKIQTRHFRQKISGTELDVYIDKNGEVVIQEFPFEIVASRVAPVFGRARARAMRTAKEGTRDGVELELGTALLAEQTEFLISGIEKDDGLTLSSHSQNLVRWTEDGAIIDTRSTKSSTVLSPEDKILALASSPRIDFKNPVFDFVSLAIEQRILIIDRSGRGKYDVKPIADYIAKQVYERMKVSTVVVPLPASTVLSSGEGDCTEYAIVSVAALRRARLPARFVYGLKADEAGKFVSHQWIEFWDNTRFIELDPTEKNGLVTPNTIRLFSSHLPESAKILGLLTRVKVSSHEYKPVKNGQDADFN